MRSRDAADKRDFYEVLGVQRGATPDEIKRAYRFLAKQHHPDANSGDRDAEERFKEVNEAYEVLSDPDRRERYDQFGHAGVNGGGADMGFGMGPMDLFDLVFGSSRDPRRSHGPQRGADLRYDLELTLEECASGLERSLTLARFEVCGRCRGTGTPPDSPPTTCSTCRGAGQVRATQSTFLGSFSTVTSCQRCGGRGQVIKTPCVVCGGAGSERKRATVQVKIPAGVDDGQRLIVRGQGEAGPQGGPSGDLYVFLHLKPHAVFERHGRDLVCEVGLSFARAALGGPVDAPTLDGPHSIVMAPGIQTGDVFRVRGLGMPEPDRPGRGDLLVVSRVTTPTHLNSRQRAAMEEFARASGEEPPADSPGDAVRAERKSEGGLFDWVRGVFGGRANDDRD